MRMLTSRASLAGAVLAAAATALTGLVAVGPSQAATPAPDATAPAAALGSCTAPVPPAARTTFGMSVKAAPTLEQNVAQLKARFGNFKVARIFDPGLPPANAWSRRAASMAGMNVVTSFRMPPAEVLSGRHDAALRAFFQSAPSNAQVFWTYYHEPEPLIANGTFTAAQYRAAWQRIGNIAGSLCRSNLFPTLILTGWTAEPAAKRNWRDYYPGDNYVSVLGWDPYNKAVGVPTSYKSPESVFGKVRDISRAAGKPWAIAETGSARMYNDYAGHGRAAWITASGQYLRSNGALWVSWFQSTRNGDFELRDQPGITAYSALIAGR